MNKNVIIGILIVLIVAALGGGYFLTRNTTQKPAPQISKEVNEEIVPTIPPEDIGLTFTARQDKKAVRLSIEKLSDIKHFEYEITYEADSPEDKTRVSRGITGELDVEPSQETYKSEDLDLGSCSNSSGVRKCRFDLGVTSVKLLLKLTKNDDKSYQVEKTIDL